MARDISRQNATLSPDSVPPEFSPTQVLAMGALLSGKTVTSAARAAGVSRSTVQRWKADDPHFLAYYNQARREMADSVEQGLRLLSGSAVATLRRLLSRRGVADAVKLRAAAEVLRLTSKPVEGPDEVEVARNAIARRERMKAIDRMASGRS